MNYKYTGFGELEGMSQAQLIEWICEAFGGSKYSYDTGEYERTSGPKPEDFDDAQFIYAYYESDYGGSFGCLYAQNNQLFEVHGSHCSCYGLEGQWAPTVVTPAYLGNEEMQKAYGRPFDPYGYGVEEDNMQEAARSILRFHFGPYSDEE